MHAAHPFLSVWDDHEVEDNYADGQPSSNQQDPSKTQLKDYPRRVPFAQREANGHQAFFNFMPRARFKGDRDRVFEEYRLGKLVDVLMTDERQYRDRQPCNDAQLTACADADCSANDAGGRQLEWFKSAWSALADDLEGLGDGADGDGDPHRSRACRRRSTPGTATATSASRSSTTSSTTTSRTWSRSRVTSTPSSPAPPTHRRPGHRPSGVPRVRRRIRHLHGAARGDWPITEHARGPRGGQPAHQVLRLHQARLWSDRARANRGRLRAQGGRRQDSGRLGPDHDRQVQGPPRCPVAGADRLGPEAMRPRKRDRFTV